MSVTSVNGKTSLRRQQKRHGQGGAFDSSTDYMGLTKSMVMRDRRKQEENLVSKDFLEEKLADLKGY